MTSFEAAAESLAVSPCCGENLTDDACSRCGHAFHRARGKLILILDEQSVVDVRELARAGAQSLVRRRRRSAVLLRLRRWLAFDTSPTRRNIDDLVGLSGSSGRILIIGGGARGRGTENLYGNARARSVIIDIYASDDVDLLADGHALPFPDETFDSVLIQAVLEHVVEPSRVVAEIYRVLKADGYVYAETPFLQNVHEGPWDFTRFTVSGHRWLFRNFEVLRAGALGGPFDQLCWSISYLFWSLTRRRFAQQVVKLVLLPLSGLDRFIPEKFRVDSATGTYFLGRKRGDSLPMRSLIDFYGGAQ